jgi:hypothetical protein
MIKQYLSITNESATIKKNSNFPQSKQGPSASEIGCEKSSTAAVVSASRMMKTHPMNP